MLRALQTVQLVQEAYLASRELRGAYVSLTAATLSLLLPISFELARSIISIFPDFGVSSSFFLAGLHGTSRMRQSWRCDSLFHYALLRVYHLQSPSYL